MTITTPQPRPRPPVAAPVADAPVAGPLLDPRVGIVRRLERTPLPAQFPPSFTLVTSRLADTSRFSPWTADASGAGYAFADEGRAIAAAVGEAVERYCGYLVRDDLVTASYRELRSLGLDAVDPDELALFTPEQCAGPGPFTYFDRDTAVDWTPGRDIDRGTTVWVPASLVWVAYHESPWAAGRPVTNPIVQAGLSAGPTAAWAEAGALYEIIERDAMTLCWAGRRGLLELRVPPALDRLARGPLAAFATRWLSFPNEFGVPVIGALVLDRTTGYLSLGMGATADPLAAATKALGEAFQLQLLLAHYDDPDGAFMAAAAGPSSPLKPWRSNCDYASAYRDDLRDVVDYGCHLQLFLDPAVQRRFHDELDDALLGTVALTEIRPAPPDLGSTLASLGLRRLAVDVTTDDVQPLGWHATRVLVPGCYANSAAGLPFLGGSRLDRTLDHHGAERRALPLPH